MKYLTIGVGIVAGAAIGAIGFLSVLGVMLSRSPANDLSVSIYMGLDVVALAILAGALILRR